MSYGVTAVEKERSLKSIARLKQLQNELKYEWPQIASGNVTPLEMAIAFLDDTLVGLAHRKPQFDELCEHFGAALREAVVDNHELFNNSVGLYHLLLNTAQDSQKQAEAIGDLIESSTQDMRTRNAFLKELDSSSAKYSETIETLDAMEEMAAIPGEVERLVGEKKIHEVYDVIAQGYATAAKYNLWSLSAMALIQNFLEIQLHTLYDMIVEEVKNEIYLRNAVSVKDSWLYLFQSASPSAACWIQLLNLSTLEQCIHNLANVDPAEVAQRLGEPTDGFLKKLLPRLNKKSVGVDINGIDYSVLLDSTLNTSVQLYFYLYRLLCTAAKLNKLGLIVSILLTSLRLEIQVLISRVTEETKLAHLQRLAKLQKNKKMDQSLQQDRLSTFKLYDAAVPVIHDFFFSVFMACLTVLQRHRVVCEIFRIITMRDNVSISKRDSIAFAPDPQYDFEIVWKVILEELRGLILIYISEQDGEINHLKEEASATYGGNEGKIHQVLMKKQLFSFEDADTGDFHSKASQKLNETAGGMLPGFEIRKDRTHGTLAKDSSPYISNEHFNSSIQVLVPQTIFNMRIILEHMLVFVAGSQRLFDGLNQKKQAPSHDFFLDVMNHAFLTRLRDVIDLAFLECMVSDSRDARSGFGQGVVALTPESGKDVSNLQIMLSLPRVYSNAIQFRRLFVTLCYTINTSFSYRRDMSGLVLDVLKNFAKSYFSYHLDLITTGGSQDITEIRIGAAAGLQSTRPTSQVNQWMRVERLLQLSGRLMLALTQADSLKQTIASTKSLVQEEISLMLSTKNAFDHSKEDLLDDDWFHHVSYLILTSLWVLLWLPLMRKESNYNLSPLNNDSNRPEDIEKLKFEYSFLENGRPPPAILERTQHIYLTLSLDKIVDFDDVIKTFETIRDNTLIALRYDLRLKALHHIGQSFKESFLLSTEPADCDPFILLFNKEIYFIGTRVQDLLSPSEIECVFYGLPQFVNQAFISGSELIKVVNRNGIKRILLNIFTVQQVLRTAMKKEDSVDLGNASRYFEMFTSNEKVMLENLSEGNPYSQKEVMNLVRLMYSEKLNSSTVSQFNKTMYADMLAKAKELFK